MKTILTIILLSASLVSWGSDFFKDSIFRQGDRMIANGVFFSFDRMHILEESYPHLDSMVTFLKLHDSLTIEIGNHGDSRGSDAYCIRLTDRRARSVYDYFVSAGIPAERITYRGYGETMLLIPDSAIEVMGSTEEKEAAHQRNRRTEYIITDTNYSGPADLPGKSDIESK